MKLFKKAVGLMKIILNAILLTGLFPMLQPFPTHCYTTEERTRMVKGAKVLLAKDKSLAQES